MPVTCVPLGGTHKLSLAQSVVCCDNPAQALQSRNEKKKEISLVWECDHFSTLMEPFTILHFIFQKIDF